MPHEAHAHFANDSGIHQPRVVGVPHVVKTIWPDACLRARRLPRRLYGMDSLALELEDQPFVFSHVPEQAEESARQWDFTTFALGSLAPTHKEQAPRKVDVVPSLRQELSATEPRIEGRDDDGAEMRFGRPKQRILFVQTHHGSLPLPFPFETHSTQGIREEQ